MLQQTVQIDTLKANAINIFQIFEATTTQIMEHLEVLKNDHIGGVVPVSTINDSVAHIKKKDI